jgi:serine/threonine-protein kinase
MNTRKRSLTIGLLAVIILTFSILILVFKPWQLFDQINGLDIGSSKVSKTDGMILVYVPAGNFIMGSDEDSPYDIGFPQHTVYLDAFWIDSTEVTNTMFAKFVAATKYKTGAEITGSGSVMDSETPGPRNIQMNGADWLHPRGPSSDITNMQDYPVVQIDWIDAKSYCEWAGRRLPSEAEWEKAARGTDGRIYPWGNQPPTGELANIAGMDLVSLVGWADPNLDDGYKFTAPVGNYPEGVSSYGAFDMAGNVWEAVADYYDRDYYAISPARNPTGPSSGGGHVLRGGSWMMDAFGVRTAFRAGIEKVPESRGGGFDGLGFRCASSIE